MTHMTTPPLNRIRLLCYGLIAAEVGGRILCCVCLMS